VSLLGAGPSIAELAEAATLAPGLLSAAPPSVVMRSLLAATLLASGTPVLPQEALEDADLARFVSGVTQVRGGGGVVRGRVVDVLTRMHAVKAGYG
jgi:hypothetical protein